jgi:cytochrome c55X
MLRLHLPPCFMPAIALLWACAQPPWANAEEGSGPSNARQRDLTRLVVHDCGSCHGMRLTGGLGPPLTRDSIARKPRDSMVATIMHGRRGTAMPPWSGLLNEADAAWIVDRLQEGRLDAR